MVQTDGLAVQSDEHCMPFGTVIFTVKALSHLHLMAYQGSFRDDRKGRCGCRQLVQYGIFSLLFAPATHNDGKLDPNGHRYDRRQYRRKYLSVDPHPS
jgi:hypothetical protein